MNCHTLREDLRASDTAGLYRPGLPAEEQEHIWDRFHRVEGVKVVSGTGIGLGLGLHICRTIIARHHGQVGMQSEPGHGATFWFILPRTSPGSAYADAESKPPCW